MSTLAFAKGHGTENDFVILHDETASCDLTPGLVAALCDRRAGIGGDGVLRVARTSALVEAGVIAPVDDTIHPDTWFMDYRNADGTTAEMCGNGVRVFAHWLCSRGLVDTTSFNVATRAGMKPVTVGDCTDTHATVTVHMGTPRVHGVTTARVNGTTFTGLAVDMGNPHLACLIDDADAKSLTHIPVEKPFTVDASFFPHGVNVEIATDPTVDGDNNVHLYMRVHERGAGETRACGTGTVATAVAALTRLGRDTGTVHITEPGGELIVDITRDGSTLTGPSTILANGLIATSALTRDTTNPLA